MDNDDESMNQQDQSYIEDRNTNSDADAENVEDTDEFTEDPYKQNITIDDINIVTEMNMSQMAT